VFGDVACRGACHLPPALKRPVLPDGEAGKSVDGRAVTGHGGGSPVHMSALPFPGEAKAIQEVERCTVASGSHGHGRDLEGKRQGSLEECFRILGVAGLSRRRSSGSGWRCSSNKSRSERR